MVATEVERREGWVILAVAGEIDVHSSALLRDGIADAVGDGVDRLLLDLSAVTFIDSTALSVMVAAHKRLRRQGHALRVVVGPAVERVLSITGLVRVFEVHGSRESALPS